MNKEAHRIVKNIMKNIVASRIRDNLTSSILLLAISFSLFLSIALLPGYASAKAGDVYGCCHLNSFSGNSGDFSTETQSDCLSKGSSGLSYFWEQNNCAAVYNDIIQRWGFGCAPTKTAGNGYDGP